MKRNKFDNPVAVTFSMERKTMDKVEKNAYNKTKFYNDAIKEKLERIESGKEERQRLW